MYKIQCDECSKTFTKTSKVKAQMARSMHMGRVHLKTIMNGASAPRHVAHAHNGHAHQEDISARAVGRNGPAAPQHKRRVQRLARQITRKVHLNYCPECGVSLRAVARGIAIAAEIIAAETQPSPL